MYENRNLVTYGIDHERSGLLGNRCSLSYIPSELNYDNLIEVKDYNIISKEISYQEKSVIPGLEMDYSLYVLLRVPQESPTNGVLKFYF